MAYALAKENERFINRMIRQGRFNNQSEVVREALRRMERQETSYLNPPPLSLAELNEVYQPQAKQDELERRAVRASQRSIRIATRTEKRSFDTL